MCGLCQIQSALSNDQIYSENYVAKQFDNHDTAMAIALPEIGKNTCIAMQKLLTLVSFSTSFTWGMFASESPWAPIFWHIDYEAR